MLRTSWVPVFLCSVLLAGSAVAHCLEPYPPSLVKAFKRNCASNPQMADFCGCMIDGIQKTIPLAEFIEAGDKPGGINAEPRFIKANQECVAKFPPAAAQPISNQVEKKKAP